MSGSRGAGGQPGSPCQDVRLFVSGPMMRGMPAHDVLDGAVFTGPAATAARYRLMVIGFTSQVMAGADDPVLAGRSEAPVLVSAGPGRGVLVSGEVYVLGLPHLARVLEQAGAGEKLGVVELGDGSHCLGLIWSGRLPPGSADVSQSGGWRQYLAARADTAG